MRVRLIDVVCRANYDLKSFSLYTVFTMFFMAFGFAIASEANKNRIYALNRQANDRYISLACSGGTVEFVIQWATKVGEPGKYRRHLFLPGNLGDTHILLKVLPDQTSTGVIDSDQTAKALIKTVLQNIKANAVYVEVFPAGRDPVTGSWERSQYKYGDFLKITNAVAKECNWNIQDPLDATVRTVKPGAPY